MANYIGIYMESLLSNGGARIQGNISNATIIQSIPATKSSIKIGTLNPIKISIKIPTTRDGTHTEETGCGIRMPSIKSGILYSNQIAIRLPSIKNGVYTESMVNGSRMSAIRVGIIEPIQAAIKPSTIRNGAYIEGAIGDGIRCQAQYNGIIGRTNLGSRASTIRTGIFESNQVATKPSTIRNGIYTEGCIDDGLRVQGNIPKGYFPLLTFGTRQANRIGRFNPNQIAIQTTNVRNGVHTEGLLNGIRISNKIGIYMPEFLDIASINLVNIFNYKKTNAIKTWHVSTKGNDINGDGSVSKPFATFNKAVNTASSGDAIYINAGEYRFLPISISSYTAAGIFDLGKSLLIYGDNKRTKINIYCSDNITTRDAPLFYCTNPSTIITNLEFHFYPNRSNNYSNALFTWCKCSIYNIAIDIVPTYNASINYNNNGGGPIVQNSIIRNSGTWAGNYSGYTSFTDCIIDTNVNTLGNTITSSLIRKYSNSDEDKIQPDCLHYGSLLNLNGSYSNIGVFGGRYAWPSFVFLFKTPSQTCHGMMSI